MSLHYLLDGYNILKQNPALRDLTLEEGRKGLLKWIAASRPQGSIKNQVTVIFDGHPDHFGGGQGDGNSRVIFSDGCLADDTIKRMVEEDNDRKNCVVVSDDKDIFLYARSLGAKVMSVKMFIKGQRIGPRPKEDEKKLIPLSYQDKINKELSRIWLKE